MTFAVARLPQGLQLDADTGILRGAIQRPGEYAVTLRARNSLGTAKRRFRIVVGDRIALTPPMGWSSWYSAKTKIGDKLIRLEANAMISTGLVNYGYSYINIDDGWNIQPSSTDPMLGGAPRNSEGNLRPNGYFPDMKALSDSLHRQGLKIGIYSSPGPVTCGGYEGSYGHEAQDARQFDSWGFDFLKYDLCSYRKLLPAHYGAAQLQVPYRLMASKLREQDRDLVYNLCEYGDGDVWKWGRQAGGNLWRTTGDVGWVKTPSRDSLWKNVANYGFGQAGLEKWAAPGGWNDPDNILIGQIQWHDRLIAAPLTHNEQYAYVTLWSLMASPLVIGGDLTRMDPFTFSLLANAEVIAVDQDALGRQAAPVSKIGDVQIWAKDMEDGSKAIGLFNLGDRETQVIAQWSNLGLHGKHTVRDLWRQKNLGKYNNAFHASVGPHGAEMFLIDQ